MVRRRRIAPRGAARWRAACPWLLNRNAVVEGRRDLPAGLHRRLDAGEPGISNGFVRFAGAGLNS